MVAAVIIAALAGVVAGLFLGRQQMRRRSATESVSPAVDTDSTADDDLAQGLHAAVERLEMGVVLCDSRGNATYRNNAANAWTGSHGGVIIDHHLRQIFEATIAGQPTYRVVELVGPPKATFSIDARATPDGGAVATITDISERVRIDSMRTDFVANISHELKTPVGAIAVLAEMLADETNPATIESLSGRVVEESHRAARTIDDLLVLSSIESSHVLDDIVDLEALVADGVARGRMVGDGRSVNVTAFDLPEPLQVRADRRQLASAIGNLVENAVKYSDDAGQVQVRIRRNERWVEIMVADHGVGIPPGDLDRVFERFYRVDKARARETGGTGLGLAIVRHVMNNHGGDVSVSSEEGQGSTFVLRLPARLIVESPAELGMTSGAPRSTEEQIQHHE